MFIFIAAGLYYILFRDWEMKNTMVLSLVLELLVTAIALEAFTESKSIVALSVFIIFGKGTFMAFAQLPTMIALTGLIPSRVEASMASLIVACTTFSSNWGGKFMTAIMFSLLGVEKDMEGLYLAVEYKLIITVFFIFLATNLPSREDIKAAKRHLNV